jgi:hypothetical protein
MKRRILNLSTICTFGPLLSALTLAACSDAKRVEVASNCERIQVAAEGGETEAVSGGDPGTCSGLCNISNGAFCSDNTVTDGCSASGSAIEVCGVALADPPKEKGAAAELQRSENVKDYAGSGPADLSCLMAGSYPEPADPAASQKVTLTGIAKIFSNGCQSRDLEIAVHRVIRDGSENEGNPGDLVGQTVVTASDCEAAGGEFEDIEDCSGGRYECTFEYPDVPSETELMVITNGKNWAPIYEYGLFVRNAEIKDGTFDKDVRALAADDYQVIAQVAMGKNITKGRGAVAGEVRDCQNVRLINAVVDVDKPSFIVTYFTDNEDSPLPDLSRSGTSTLGLYSAMDIEPGPVTIAAAGVMDGKLVGVGHFTARVFPDAVTSFAFQGLRPFQVSK